MCQYFQVKQEEDNLGADRLKKGYQVAVTSYEHESIVYNVKVLFFCQLFAIVLVLRGDYN